MADSTTTAKSVAQRRRILIIAGPTGPEDDVRMEFLLNEATCPTFINADLIAAGMNPFQPEEEAIRAGRLMLKLIDEHVSRGDSFAFETTLSGRAYARKIPLWRKMGYEVVLYFLTLPSADDAIRRVAERVRGGGTQHPRPRRSGDGSIPVGATSTKSIKILSMSGNCSIIAGTGRYSWQGGTTHE